MAKKELSKSIGDYSYNQIRSELQSLINEKYGEKSKSGDYYVDSPYINDLYKDEVVVSYKGKYYIADYEVSKDGEIKLGDFYNAKMVPQKVGTAPVKQLGKKS